MYEHHRATETRGLVSALSLTALLIAATAAADEQERIVSIHATSVGLDLSAESGMAAFYHRIQQAARLACTRGDQVGLKPVDDLDACAENAIADAVRQANRATLTQVYLATHSAQAAAAHGISLPTKLAAK